MLFTCYHEYRYETNFSSTTKKRALWGLSIRPIAHHNTHGVHKWIAGVVVVGRGLVICKIASSDLFFRQKSSNLNLSYSLKKLGNQTTPNSDNLKKSYGCLNFGLLARAFVLNGIGNERMELNQGLGPLLILYIRFMIWCDISGMCCCALCPGVVDWHNCGTVMVALEYGVGLVCTI